MRNLSLIALALLLPMVGSTQVTKQGNAYLLRVKYTKGQVLVFNGESEVKLVPQLRGRELARERGPYTWVTTQTVVDVVKGVATLSTFKHQPIPPNKIHTEFEKVLKIDTRGNWLSGRPPFPYYGEGFPLKAVKIGDRWTVPTGHYDYAFGQKVQSMLTCKLTDVDRETAKIELFFEAGSGPFSKVTGTGELHILVRDGTLQSLRWNVISKRPSDALMSGALPRETVVSMRYELRRKSGTYQR